MSSKKIELYDPPSHYLLPCIAPNIVPLEMGDALALNYQRYKAASETCATLHNSFIEWYDEARKALAEPAVVK